ncbi:MAG: DUF2721 domain-containing protein [Methylophilaceae bacterium]
MQIVQNLTTVATTIQLAVAPVFLLTGIGALLGVMATRLARVVDRFRVLKEMPSEMHLQREQEMATLLRRSRWVHWAITLSVVSALLICIVIAFLFLGTEINFAPSRTVSLLFVSAMLMLICGLLCFLREIFLSTKTIQ